jgi:YHS domain-containing protein
MIRAVLYIFLAIIVISLIRSIIGILGKGLSALFGPGTPDRPAAGEPRKAGELKRDPVCGTYISTASSVKRTIGGRVMHFCSNECADKYKG